MLTIDKDSKEAVLNLTDLNISLFELKVYLQALSMKESMLSIDYQDGKNKAVFSKIARSTEEIESLLDEINQSSFLKLKIILNDPNLWMHCTIFALEYQISGLQELECPTKQFINSEASHFAEALIANRTVKKLKICHSIISIDALALLIETNPNIEELILKNIPFYSPPFYAQTRSLQEEGKMGEEKALLRRLTALTTSLQISNVGPENNFNSIVPVVEALSKNRTLKKLIFKGRLGTTAAINLSEMLKLNSTLQRLQFDANTEIGISGIKAILEALKSNKGLKTLIFCRRNKMYSWTDDNDSNYDSCMSTLAEMLQTNSTLECVDFDYNTEGTIYNGLFWPSAPSYYARPISKAALDKIYQAMANNFTLERFNEYFIGKYYVYPLKSERNPMMQYLERNSTLICTVENIGKFFQEKKKVNIKMLRGGIRCLNEEIGFDRAQMPDFVDNTEIEKSEYHDLFIGLWLFHHHAEGPLILTYLERSYLNPKAEAIAVEVKFEVKTNLDNYSLICPLEKITLEEISIWESDCFIYGSPENMPKHLQFLPTPSKMEELWDACDQFCQQFLVPYSQ